MYYWRKLVGDRTTFGLKTQIFHGVCVAIIIGIGVNLPLALMMEASQLAVVICAVTIGVMFLLYQSRVKRRFNLSVTLFHVLVNIGLCSAYYYSSGIYGVGYAVFLVAFFVSVLTAPKRQYYIWLPLNVLLLVALMTWEYLNPGAVPEKYPDNFSRYIDFMFSYLIGTGFIFFTLSFVWTAYKRQHNELRAQKADLEKANRTKNMLLSILGHDLKEPLASLEGYLEMLTELELDEDEKKQINTQLLAMTKNTSLLLTNLVTWTKSQTYSFLGRFEVLNVREALAPVIALAGSVGQKKQISVTVDVPAALGVRADKQMLSLIVRNLLMNAIKFTPKGGHILLQAKPNVGECIITITDNGIGIPPALQAGIFSMNNEARRGTESEKGAGIGLMLCKDFADILGGKLSFTTSTNGTSFSLVVPLALVAYNSNGIDANADMQPVVLPTAFDKKYG